MKNISLFFVFVVFMEGVFGESVTEGSSVTLKTDLSEINSEVIEWRFEGIFIGRVRKGIKPTLDEDVLDGKFKGRLKLNSQTGDLTISSTKTSDSGEYKVSNGITDLKTFNVTVNAAAAPESGLSPGGIAGIAISVIAVVAAIVGGIYYGYKKRGEML